MLSGSLGISVGTKVLTVFSLAEGSLAIPRFLMSCVKLVLISYFPGFLTALHNDISFKLSLFQMVFLKRDKYIFPKVDVFPEFRNNARCPCPHIVSDRRVASVAQQHRAAEVSSGRDTQHSATRARPSPQAEKSGLLCISSDYLVGVWRLAVISKAAFIKN